MFVPLALPKSVDQKTLVLLSALQPFPKGAKPPQTLAGQSCLVSRDFVMYLMWFQDKFIALGVIAITRTFKSNSQSDPQKMNCIILD